MLTFRRKKVKGQDRRVRRTWMADGYRITWRKEAFGVALPPGFQPAVRVVLPDGSQMWDFAGRRLCKTMRAAIEVCEHHHNLWLKANEETSAHGLKELFGRVPCCYPLWVKPSRKLYELVMNTKVEKCSDQPDQPETSNSTPTSSDTSAQPSGPASLVMEPKVTDAPATSVQAPAKERKQRSRKPIGKQSKTGKRGKTSTSGLSPKGKRQRKSSPKARSKPSAV